MILLTSIVIHTVCLDCLSSQLNLYIGKNLIQSLQIIDSLSNLKNIGWVFAGTLSKKYPPDPKNEAGWGTLIEKNNLKSIQTISLPTVWTFHEPDETPYVFTQTISE